MHPSESREAASQMMSRSSSGGLSFSNLMTYSCASVGRSRTLSGLGLVLCHPITDAPPVQPQRPALPQPPSPLAQPHQRMLDVQLRRRLKPVLAPPCATEGAGGGLAKLVYRQSAWPCSGRRPCGLDF